MIIFADRSLFVARVIRRTERPARRADRAKDLIDAGRLLLSISLSEVRMRSSPRSASVGCILAADFVRPPYNLEFPRDVEHATPLIARVLVALGSHDHLRDAVPEI